MGSSSRIPVWLDVDTGHDDAFAILLAAHHPRFELLGVTTVHGNAPLEYTTYNTRAILEAIGRRDVSVYPGSSKPAIREAVHAGSIHGISGLDGTTLLPEPVAPAVTDVDWVEAMYNALSSTSPRSAWLVATGTLTNIGKLFEVHPDLAEHLQGLSIMGGAIGGGFSDAPMGKKDGEGERFGNWTAFAEFNIYCDPEAALSLFSNPTLAAKTTLLPLDVTHQVLATTPVRDLLLWGPELQAKFLGKTKQEARVEPMLPSTVRALYHEILAYFAQTYADEFSLTEGPPVHDPLAVAAIIVPEIFHEMDVRYAVDVITEGEHSLIPGGAGECGRTVVTKLEKGKEGIRIPRGLDVSGFWSLMDTMLGEADKRTPLPRLTSSWLSSRVAST